jgi:GntR family transcriptional regulator
MVSIDNASAVPIYEQVKDGLRGLVARKLLGPGDQVPPIRGLAELLVVNPNTIARAYRELILEGFLETRKGEGAFIARGAVIKASNGMESVRRRLVDNIILARRAGLAWKDVQSAIHEAKEEEANVEK